MNTDRANLFMATHGKYFPADRLFFLRDKISQMDDDRFMMLNAIDYKDPTMMLIVSVLVGEFGIDRFLLGDIGMGILKLITGGLCGILWILDIIGIMRRTREHNFHKVMYYL